MENGWLRWKLDLFHMRFSEADIPDLFEKRPYKNEETRTPGYLYRIDNDGIQIALFYNGLPKDKPT